MSKAAKSSGSFAPSAMSSDRLPSRQRWDHRYASLPPKARLEPTAFVAACLPKLPGRGWALDIAAGAGRHTIALAQHGLQVEAVDISGQGLRLARERAMAAGLIPGRQIRYTIADLERSWLPRRDYDVILVSFFLHRPLFPLIKARLRPGGWLVYETFTVEQTRVTPHRSFRASVLLQPEELRQAFGNFEILSYAEGLHNEKATAQLLARKPKGSTP